MVLFQLSLESSEEEIRTQTCTEKRPCENTGGDGHLTSQGERPQKKPNLLMPWSETLILQNYEKINCCCFIRPARHPLLWSLITLITTALTSHRGWEAFHTLLRFLQKSVCCWQHDLDNVLQTGPPSFHVSTPSPHSCFLASSSK